MLKIIKYASKPSFISQKIFSKNFVAIHKIKPILLLNKPIYVEFSILELSKLFMYDLHFNYFKKKFDVKLLLADTDSLRYEIKGEDDVYEKIYLDKDLFDFSNYPSSTMELHSKFYDVTNKKVVFKIKDELLGKVISEFIGLKSKMYSLVTADDEEKIKAKGVNKTLRQMNLLMFYLIKKLLDIIWTEFKVKDIDLVLMVFTKFPCLVLMIKCIY